MLFGRCFVNAVKDPLISEVVTQLMAVGGVFNTPINHFER